MGCGRKPLAGGQPTASAARETLLRAPSADRRLSEIRDARAWCHKVLHVPWTVAPFFLTMPLPVGIL